MYGFRRIADNRVMLGIGIAVLVIVLGVGTYLAMYKPGGALSVHFGGSQLMPQPAQSGPTGASGGISETAPPTPQPEKPLTPTLPPRSTIGLKVQNAGAQQQKVDDLLAKAKQLGYQASPADTQGKTMSGVVIRYKPGMAGAAARAASDLAPGASLEEHSDISTDIVVAVGKT